MTQRPQLRPVPRVDRPPARPAGFVLTRGRAIALGAVVLLLAAWAGVSTFLILFRDEVAQTVFARQAELRFGYEDRIAQLQAALERETTAGLVERRTVSIRVDALIARQEEIDARQSWLAGAAERLGDRARTSGSSLTLPVLRPATDPALAPTGKPVPLDERAGAARRAPDRLSALESAASDAAIRSVAAAEAMRRTALDRSMRLRLALEATGLGIRRFEPTAASATSTPPLTIRAGEPPMGGPLVPVGAGPDGPVFTAAANGLDEALGETARLAALVRSVPLGQPLEGAPDVTSPFGRRLDPFTRGLALHTGLDLRAEAGAPVRATAGGRVTVAEATGGYGLMVEVEHENGLATRYGHLSAVTVAPGQVVSEGQVVGRAGSTGRSTGNHLHYETRIDGEPVNPARFLAAGRLLAE